MYKYIVAGGMAAVALVAKIAYEKFFNKQQILSKQLIIKKLIDMRQYMYPILFQISDIVATKLIPKGVPPEQAKMFIMESQQLAFKQNIANLLQQKVYFDIDQQTLQFAIQHTYKDDKEVQFYKKAFQQEYDKCFLGIKPENLSTKIIIITQETLLKIVATLLDTKIQKLRQIILDCQQQVGKLKQQSSAQMKYKVFAQRLSTELSKDENQDDILRHRVLQHYNINDVKTFQFSVAKFLQQSTEFKQKYQELQAQFKQNAQQIITSAQ